MFTICFIVQWYLTKNKTFISFKNYFEKCLNLVFKQKPTKILKNWIPGAPKVLDFREIDEKSNTLIGIE
jgi:hypothetical protein